jgi:carbonic anhydrase
MSDLPILLIGCDEVEGWPSVLQLEPGARLTTLGTPGAIIPPAELDSPLRRQLERLVAGEGIRDIVLVGHTDCRVLHSALLGDARGPERELAGWLADAGLTREALEARYPACEGQGLLEVAAQECLMAQAERLMAYPALREAAEQGSVRLELWIFDAATRAVHVFDPERGQFEPTRRLSGCERPLHAGRAR